MDIIPIASYVIVFEKKHAQKLSRGTSRFKTQHNFPSSSMDLQNKLEAQIRSLKEGDEGFYAIITWYVVEKWGKSLYGSKEEFERRYAKFFVHKVKTFNNGRLDFKLKFPAYGNKIISFSLESFLRDELMVKYYYFDTADLPANHIMLEKVPRGLFPGSKKRKQPAELSVDVLPVAKLPEMNEEPTALPVIPPHQTDTNLPKLSISLGHH